MDRLAFHETSNNGLSFELLVNGKPLCEMIGGEEGGIPYWLFEDNLPHYPPFGLSQDRTRRIVCVCECGEYGCGHTSCRLVEDNGVVTLCEFSGVVSPSEERRSFTFEAGHFQEVVAEMVRRAKKRNIGKVIHL